MPEEETDNPDLRDRAYVDWRLLCMLLSPWPDQAHMLWLAIQETDNPDLRDRAYVYWRLLSSDPEAARAVVLAEKPVISQVGFIFHRQASFCMHAAERHADRLCWHLCNLPVIPQAAWCCSQHACVQRTCMHADTGLGAMAET